MQQHQPPRQYSGHGISSAFSSSAHPDEDEDWTKISDLAERRRIQNRIAQRNYRKKLKKRLEDLERRAGTLDDSSSPGTEKTSPVQKRELYDLDVDCEPEMGNETISGRCRDIRQQLTDLLTALENGSAQVSTTVTSSSIKDVLERFMLWAGNLGALRKSASKLSLDSRLAGSSDLRDYICTELDDMSEAIEDLMNIVNGSMPNRELGHDSGSENDLDMESDESSDESSYADNPVDEAGSILQVISQGITSLLKIGILVRQPASSGTDRFHRASRDSTNAFLDRFDIDYVRHKHPKLGAGDQSSRMGKAIAKRRQFIRYCRDHKSNLAAEENEGKDTSNPQIGSQKATTAKQSSKATTFVAKENLMDILQGSVDVLEEEEDAVSHCSVSTTSESLAILKLPRLADLSPDDDPFECPICYTLQQFRSEQSWRRHAYRDLKAYVCTVGGTECDDKFFDDRTSWFNHELEQHRSGYVCVLCGANDGQSKRKRDELRQHILSDHGDFESDQLERLEDAGRDTATTLKAKDCPFCDDWSELIARKMPPGKTAQPGDDFVVSTSRFKKHVAMHLEQLAIFALPRHEHETGMDEDGSHGSDSRVVESRSSKSLAGSFRSGDDRDIEDYQGDPMTPINQNQVIQAVLSRMRLKSTPATGWQATHIQLPERVKKTSALATHLKLVGQAKSWLEAVIYAMDDERYLFLHSPDKPTYENLLAQRLQQLGEQIEDMEHEASSRSSSFTELPSSYRYTDARDVTEGFFDYDLYSRPDEATVTTDISLERYSVFHSAPSASRDQVARIPAALDNVSETAEVIAAASERWPPFPDRSASFSREDLPQESASGDSAPPPTNTAPDLPSTQGSPQDDMGSMNTSTEALQPLKESASPVADSEQEEPGSIEEKSTSGSHDSYEKDNDDLEYMGTLKYVVRSPDYYHGSISYNLKKKIEDRQQGLDQSVGKSSHPPAKFWQSRSSSHEVPQSLGPDDQPAARPNSLKDMTTGEPAGTNNSGINVSPPLVSTKEEDRQREIEKHLARLEESGRQRVVVPSAVITEDDRLLVELKKQHEGKSFEYIASLHPRQRSANYWARRWHQITDVPRDNSDAERKDEDDSNTSDPSLQREEVRDFSPVRLVRSSETEKSPTQAPEKWLDPELEKLKQDREEFQLEEKRKKEEENELQADHNAKMDRAIKEAQQTAEEKAAQDCMQDEEGQEIHAKMSAASERMARDELWAKIKANEQTAKYVAERKAAEEKRNREGGEAAVARWETKKAERVAKKKEEKEYQRRLEEDLINSGLDEKAIIAILKKEKIKEGKKSSDGVSESDKEDRPTYIRMSLRYVDVRTLYHFKIDFEYDAEPGYLLIKRSVLEEGKLQQLWDHTRQIRTAGTKEVSETLVIKGKGRPVRPLDEYDERYHHDDQTTRTESRDRTSNGNGYDDPGPVEGHTRQFSSTSQLPSHDTRTFINPPAQQAALAAQQQRLLQQRTMAASGFHGQGNPMMTDQMTQAQPQESIAAEQQMNAHQEQQQPHMMAPGTRDVAAQEGEEPPSAPGGRTRQRPESDKHPDQFHNEVVPEDLQSSTRRAKYMYRCPVSSCNKEYGRKDNLTKHLLRVHGRPIVNDDEPASMSSTIDDGPNEDTRSLGTSPSHPRSGMADHTSRDEYSQTHGGQTESSLRDKQAQENLDLLVLERDIERFEERKRKKLQEELKLRKAKEEPDGSRKKKGEEEEEGGGIQLQDKEEEGEKLLRAKYLYEETKVKERNLNEEEKRIAKEVLKGEEEEIRRQQEERRTRRALAAKDARDSLPDTAKYQTETIGDPIPLTAETLRRAAGGRDESDYRHPARANPHEDVTMSVQKGKGAVCEGPEARMTEEEFEDEIRQHGHIALRFGRSKSEATNNQKRTSMHEGNEVILIPSAHEELEGVEKPDRGTPPNRRPHIVPW